MNDLTPYQRYQLEKYGNVLPEHQFAGFQQNDGDKLSEWINRHAELEIIAHER